MNKKYSPLFYLFFLCFATVFSQPNTLLKVRSYQLKNGMTVFLNEDSTATKIFGGVMVKAGAKNESPDATGMAHYLEHMLFKGTQILGTSNYEKEKPFLDSINVLYTQLALANETKEKNKIQQAINEQALQASKYGLPGEIHKLLSSIGGTGINAFTTSEMTFYHNYFPVHEINKWLDLYSTRFQEPVFRSFQSELEVVYEEKNRSLDNFENAIEEKMQSLIFPNLPYGQWPVLGTVEHLKKPSLIKMYEFYNKNYVANNMALILSGNFNSEKIIPLIAEKFEALKAGKIEPLNLPKPTPIAGEQVYHKRMTPVKAEFIGYQTMSINHPDRFAMEVCEELLTNNSRTGALDQLLLNNDLLFCETGSDKFSDAGSFSIYFAPKLINSLKKGQHKIDKVISGIGEGKFSDEQFFAIKNRLSLDYQREMEDQRNRSVLIGEAFLNNISWDTVLAYPDKINNLKKEDIMRVAKKYLGKNRIKLISRTGFPKKIKLEKPPYKPVLADQKEESVYAKKFNQLSSSEFKPRFIDFTKDVDRAEFNGHKIVAAENKVNNIFYLAINFKTGLLKNAKIDAATGAMNYCGAGDLSLKELRQRFATIGCDYAFKCDLNFVTVYLQGNETNLEKALTLTDLLLTDAKINEQSKRSYLNTTKSERILEKNKPDAMGEIFAGYAMYGNRSYFKLRASQKQIKEISIEKLNTDLKNITSQYKTEITFSGKTTANELATLISKNITLSKTPIEDTFISTDGVEVSKNTIYFINNKKAVQSQVYFYVQGSEFKIDQFANIKAFNQYFGGSFSGIVAQEIREYRSLAYSTWGIYFMPSVNNKHGRLVTFIGCQSDKTNQAIKIMASLIDSLPQKPERITSVQKTIEQQVVTNYPNFRLLPAFILSSERMGIMQDPNVKAYKEFQSLSMNDIDAFHKQNIKGKPFTIAIYGNMSKLNMDELKKIGTVIELTPKDILTY